MSFIWLHGLWIEIRSYFDELNFLFYKYVKMYLVKFIQILYVYTHFNFGVVPRNSSTDKYKMFCI